MIYAGIDAGSRAIKIVFINTENMQVIAKGLTDQGVEQDKLTSQLFENILNENSIKRKDIAAIVATGYGRNAVGIADTTITEITCHAAGVCWLVPETKTIIDIGGQDSKLLRLDGNGKVRDFAMNDRCAAGTGRFLEVVAQRLNVELDSLGWLLKVAIQPLSAVCALCSRKQKSLACSLMVRLWRILSLVFRRLLPIVSFQWPAAISIYLLFSQAVWLWSPVWKRPWRLRWGKKLRYHRIRR